MQDAQTETVERISFSTSDPPRDVSSLTLCCLSFSGFEADFPQGLLESIGCVYCYLALSCSPRVYSVRREKAAASKDHISSGMANASGKFNVRNPAVKRIMQVGCLAVPREPGQHGSGCNIQLGFRAAVFRRSRSCSRKHVPTSLLMHSRCVFGAGPLQRGLHDSRQ